MLIDFLRPILENPFFVKYGLLGLFLNSVFAAVVPFPIVITSTALLLDGPNSILVFIVMAVGSVIGGDVTYLIGYDGKKMYRLLRKTHREEHYEKSFTWVKKYDFKKFVISMSIARTLSAFASVYFGNMFLQSFNYFKF